MPASKRSTDPRSHSRYRALRLTYLARHAPAYPCCLCGQTVDLSLPGMSPWGPTIEHRIKVDALRRVARDEAELLDLCCDTTTWGIAHRRCQNRQGAGVTNGKSKPPPSRW